MDFKESRVPIAIFLVGVALVLIGNQISIAALKNLGFVCIGLASIASGVEMLVTGRATFSTWAGQSWGHYERFSGWTARLWGILFLVFGGFVCLATLLGAEAFWTWFFDTPRGSGIFLFGIGAIAIMYGVIRVIAGTEQSGSGVGATVSNFLERIWGEFVLLLGLGFVGLWAWCSSLRQTFYSHRSITFCRAFRRHRYHR